MMREMTGRYVDSFSDAGARDVNAGQANWFQDKFLERTAEMRKPPSVCGRWPEVVRGTVRISSGSIPAVGVANSNMRTGRQGKQRRESSRHSKGMVHRFH